MSAAKEIAHVFRWHRAFAKLKMPIKEVEPLSRYTNFTLNHVWEKFDCQTALLTKEALLPLAKRNPELFDPDLDNMNTVRPELKVEELQLAKGAFAMLHLNLQDVWSTVGARMTTRGGSTITQQAFAPVVREEPDRKRRKLSKDLEETSPPPSPPRR
ncbi:unnamed protein product [Durusdinium trenchii]|uniref:DNA helicase n=1 Tax=Durusdinium trenchii TaxID=1381693 RepID=A0ABP0LIF8_9DINO